MALSRRILVCISLLVTLEETLACSGKDVNRIAKILLEVEDWSGLATELDIETGTQNKIKKNCKSSDDDVADCYRRKLVQTYCDFTGLKGEQVAENIAQVLEIMGYKKQANQIRGLYSASEKPAPEPEKPSVKEKEPATSSPTNEVIHAQSHEQSEDTHSVIDTSPIKTQSQDREIGSIVPFISIGDVKAAINELNKKFSLLKEKTQHSIEEHNILVNRVADVLTSLSPDEDKHHKMFVDSRVKRFVKAENMEELFLIMNSHWNYLDPSLLSHLVSELELDDVKSITESYKSDVQQFRKKTPLKLFFQTQQEKDEDNIPSGFKTVVAKFNLPEPVMLEDVEQFRQKYASKYGLHDFAMKLIQVRPGSFIAVWLVPNAIVEKLKGNIPTAVLSQHKVQRLTVDGVLVYSDQLHESESLDENIVLYESACDEGSWSVEVTLEATFSKPAKSTLTISATTPPREDILQHTLFLLDDNQLYVLVAFGIVVAGGVAIVISVIVGLRAKKPHRVPIPLNIPEQLHRDPTPRIPVPYPRGESDVENSDPDSSIRKTPSNVLNTQIKS